MKVLVILIISLGQAPTMYGQLHLGRRSIKNKDSFHTMMYRTSLVKTSASVRFCQRSGPPTKCSNVGQDFYKVPGHSKNFCPFTTML